MPVVKENNMLKEIGSKYSQLYEAGYVSGISDKERERIRMQEDISHFIVKNPDDETVQNYLAQVQLPPRDFEHKSAPWIPHIDEAVYSTLALRELAERVDVDITKVSRVNAVYGSGTWGAFYSTHRDSDLDLEVIVDDLTPDIADLEVFSGYNERLREAIQITLDRDIDILLFEIPYGETPLMYHFLTTDRFEKLVDSIDLDHPKERCSFSQLMNNFHGLLDYTDRCNFSDERRNWHAGHEQITEELHLLDLPIYQEEDGKIFNGLFTEWHLTHPYVVSGESYWFEQKCQQVYEEFVKRWVIEEQIQGMPSRFSNILERKHRMPSWLLEEFDEKAKRIKSEMN
jgi:hypothetical protein